MTDEPEYPSQPWETPKPEPKPTPEPTPTPKPSRKQTFDPDRDTVDWSRKPGGTRALPSPRPSRRGRLNRQQKFWLAIAVGFVALFIVVGIIVGATSSDEKKASYRATATTTEAPATVTPTIAPTTAAPAPPVVTWPPAIEEFAWQSFLAGAPEHGREVDRRCLLDTLERRYPDVLAYANAPQSEHDDITLELLANCTDLTR